MLFPLFTILLACMVEATHFSFLMSTIVMTIISQSSWQVFVTFNVNLLIATQFLLLVVKNWYDGVTGRGIKNCCLAGVASCKAETI